MTTSKKVMRPILRVLVVLIPCLLVIVGYSYYISQNLAVVSYVIEAGITSPIRIVHLTDLHNAEFGENNCELVALVAEQEPDLIVMTGDMLNRDDEDLSIVTALISDLIEIAPVYFGYGNHESSWEDTWRRDLRAELTDAGAIVVNNDYADITLNGSDIRIGGYMGYYRQPHMMTQDEEQNAIELAFADEFEDTDRFKILLDHIPTAWLDWEYIDVFPVDIVFSGHYHGGLIQLPLIDQGLYAPYVGWLPPYTKGVFAGSAATCVLSAGLGSEHWIPRLNNPPEIVVVDLVPCSE